MAGFNKWRDQFSRHEKGERGIKSLPYPYKMKKEQEKAGTHAPMLDEHGKVQTERSWNQDVNV